MAETVNIAGVANKIVEDIFKWFKWEINSRMDENFPCTKGEKHKVSSTNCLTHPVDVVFSYFDPYLNKTILLNTDLKSYAKASVTATAIRKAMKSLANTVDCAQSNPVWKSRYTEEGKNYDIRGMLLVCNHDDTYDKEFFTHFSGIRLDKLVEKKNEIIHILEPKRIKYLFDVITDMQKLIANDTFPKDDYSFYYPELHLHKKNGNYQNYPATIEVLTSPYMIIQHGKVIKYDSSGNPDVKNKEGFIFYYNREGSTEHEFIYLFDTISRFQMLDKNIRIRVAHNKANDNILTNYDNAINSYVSAWGSDSYKKEQLKAIKLELVSAMTPNYRPSEIAYMRGF